MIPPGNNNTIHKEANYARHRSVDMHAGCWRHGAVIHRLWWVQHPHKQKLADIMAWSLWALEFRAACSNTILLEINVTQGKQEFGMMNHLLGGLLKIEGRSYRGTSLAIKASSTDRARMWEKEYYLLSKKDVISLSILIKNWHPFWDGGSSIVRHNDN